MSIPLIQEATKDAINTSIIAIKRNIERINMLLGLSNSEEIDTSKFATKDELQQAVTDLQPVDEVAVDNMQSVTSGAVYSALNTIETYTGITGLTLYKIGHLVYGTYSRYLSTSNPFEAGTLPSAWRPKTNYQVALINSSNDILVGQLIVYSSNGKVTLWNGVETYNGSNYAASIAYVV